MGRALKPITASGPVPDFARKLRDRLAAAPQPMTFRALAEETNYSHTVLAKAVAGTTLPSWPVVQALVIALGGEAELPRWEEDWNETRRANRKLAEELDEWELEPAARATTRASNRAVQVIRPNLADPARMWPCPERVKVFENLRGELAKFRIVVGSPTLSELVEHVRNYTGSSPGRTTLSEVFSGQRAPKLQLVADLAHTFIQMMFKRGGSRMADQPWMQVDAWADAWRLAEFNLTRPDQAHRSRVGNIYLVTTHQDAGPTASAVAEMDTQRAAATLAAIPPKVSGAILEEMQTKRAQEIIIAMQGLTGKVNPLPPDVISLGNPGADSDDGSGDGSGDGGPAPIRPAAGGI